MVNLSHSLRVGRLADCATYRAGGCLEGQGILYSIAPEYAYQLAKYVADRVTSRSLAVKLSEWAIILYKVWQHKTDYGGQGRRGPSHRGRRSEVVGSKEWGFRCRVSGTSSATSEISRRRSEVGSP